MWCAAGWSVFRRLLTPDTQAGPWWSRPQRRARERTKRGRTAALSKRTSSECVRVPGHASGGQGRQLPSSTKAQWASYFGTCEWDEGSERIEARLED